MNMVYLRTQKLYILDLLLLGSQLVQVDQSEQKIKIIPTTTYVKIYATLMKILRPWYYTRWKVLPVRTPQATNPNSLLLKRITESRPRRLSDVKIIFQPVFPTITT